MAKNVVNSWKMSANLADGWDSSNPMRDPPKNEATAKLGACRWSIVRDNVSPQSTHGSFNEVVFESVYKLRGQEPRGCGRVARVLCLIPPHISANPNQRGFQVPILLASELTVATWPPNDLNRRQNTYDLNECTALNSFHSNSNCVSPLPDLFSLSDVETFFPCHASKGSFDNKNKWNKLQIFLGGKFRKIYL